MGTSCSKHERDVRDETVADPEYGGAQPSSPDVPVRVVVTGVFRHPLGLPASVSPERGGVEHATAGGCGPAHLRHVISDRLVDSRLIHVIDAEISPRCHEVFTPITRVCHCVRQLSR